MRYLLDTNICIFIANRRPAHVSARLERMRPGDLGMSVITYLELTFGAWKSADAQENLSKIERLRRLIPVAPLDVDTANEYGRLRTELDRKGATIGAYDLLIAAHALSLGLILVTNNVREFERVGGLRVENWAA